MDSKAVNKEINFTIKPLLKQNGFIKSSGRTFWRYSADCIDVINFQSFNSYHADVIGCTTFSFAINLSCFLKYIPSQTELKTKDGEQRPSEEQGHFRRRLHKVIHQPELDNLDIWYVDSSGANLMDVLIDCGNQINKSGIVWFDQFRKVDNVLSVLLNAPIDEVNGMWGFGNFGSPVRNEYIAYAALKIGERELAAEKFNDLSEYYAEQYEQQKYPFYLQRKSIMDNEIARINSPQQ